MKLLAIGEVMAEIRKDADGGFAVGFAGDTFNTAVYCARALGEAGAVGYMTRIGKDPLSAGLMADVDAEEMDTSAIIMNEQHNIGIYTVSTDETGERSFHYWRDQSAARRLFASSADFDHLEKADIIYTSGITLAIIGEDARKRLIDRLAELSNAGAAFVAFDSNYRPRLWESAQTARSVISKMWEIADIALPSIDDEMALFDETEDQVIGRFSARDWHACAIKRGSSGPVSTTLSADAMPAFLPADRVVDTTAAGDSFNAGYLAALIRGGNEADCLSAGHQLARLVVQVPGAIVPRQRS